MAKFWTHQQQEEVSRVTLLEPVTQKPFRILDFNHWWVGYILNSKTIEIREVITVESLVDFTWNETGVTAFTFKISYVICPFITTLSVWYIILN